MVQAEVVLHNPLGLHLRPAGRLCTEALRFKSSVKFRYENSEVNGKSVLGVLSLCLRHNSHFELICDGEDEEEALQHLCIFIEENLK